MAKISVPSIEVGDEIRLDALNDFIDSANAVPGSINADNVMDEGIDRRNLALKSIQEFNSSGQYYYLGGDNEHTVQGTTWFGDVFDTAVGTLPVRIGPIVCSNNEWVLVNCSFSLYAEPPTSVAATNFGGMEFRFVLQTEELVSGYVSQIGGTERRFNSFMVMDDTAPTHSGTRYSCTIVAAFKAPVTSTGSDEIYISLLGMCSLSNVSALFFTGKVKEIKLFARVIKK